MKGRSVGRVSGNWPGRTNRCRGSEWDLVCHKVFEIRRRPVRLKLAWVRQSGIIMFGEPGEKADLSKPQPSPQAFITTDWAGPVGSGEPVKTGFSFPSPFFRTTSLFLLQVIFQFWLLNLAKTKKEYGIIDIQKDRYIGYVGCVCESAHVHVCVYAHGGQKLASGYFL